MGVETAKTGYEPKEEEVNPLDPKVAAKRLEKLRKIQGVARGASEKAAEIREQNLEEQKEREESQGAA